MVPSVLNVKKTVDIKSASNPAVGESFPMLLNKFRCTFKRFGCSSFTFEYMEGKIYFLANGNVIGTIVISSGMFEDWEFEKASNPEAFRVKSLLSTPKLLPNGISVTLFDTFAHAISKDKAGWKLPANAEHDARPSCALPVASPYHGDVSGQWKARTTLEWVSPKTESLHRSKRYKASHGKRSASEKSATANNRPMHFEVVSCD